MEEQFCMVVPNIELLGVALLFSMQSLQKTTGYTHEVTLLRDWNYLYCWSCMKSMGNHIAVQVFICSSPCPCGYWLDPGCLLHLCSIHLDLTGKKQWMIGQIGNGGWAIVVV
jgi:hypothetical protein